MAHSKQKPLALPPVMFVPGIVNPAPLSFGPLIERLEARANIVLKELEVYNSDAVPDGYSLQTEVEGIRRAADEARLTTFHLVGYSAGGIAALGFIEKYPERLLSVTLIEPFGTGMPTSTSEESAFLNQMGGVLHLPASERVQAFLPMNLAPGVPAPPPPDMSQSWMRSRPSGISALVLSARQARIEPACLAAFTRPIYVVYGSLSHPAWRAMSQTLSRLLPDCTVEVYEGLHHLSPPHRAQPERFAAALLKLWAGPGSGMRTDPAIGS